MTNSKHDIRILEGWLWEAACKIRGEIDAAKYKDFILPLIFLKRLSDVFEDEVNKLAKEYGGVDVVEELLAADHSLVRIYIPKDARWNVIAKKTTLLGEALTDAVRSIARENSKLHGVIDIKDFNETAAGQRVISDDGIKALINVLGKHRLGLDDVEPDIIGRAYEYLLRKFAEGSGKSAGEFYTPREIAILMSHILDPQPGMEVYDPCAGSGGLLIKCNSRFNEKYKGDKNVKPIKFFGQEYLPPTFGMANMNIFIHDMEAEIKLGDSMNRPAFTNPDGSLRKFDLITANPMWNQKAFEQKTTYENDSYNRFGFGYPPSSTADWGWVQHMFASLTDKGKAAVVLDTGAVSRGSGNTGKNKERDIRKEFVDKDFVEAVILMPENLFYNTTAPGIILVISKAKAKPDEILLINGSNLFAKGRPKNYLQDEDIKKISDIYLGWKEVEGISRIIKKDEAVKNDYNLSPSRYVAEDGKEEVMPLDDTLVLVREAEEERAEADEKLKKILMTMGLDL